MLVPDMFALQFRTASARTVAVYILYETIIVSHLLDRRVSFCNSRDDNITWSVFVSVTAVIDMCFKTGLTNCSVQVRGLAF